MSVSGKQSDSKLIWDIFSLLILSTWYFEFAIWFGVHALWLVFPSDETNRPEMNIYIVETHKMIIMIAIQFCFPIQILLNFR